MVNNNESRQKTKKSALRGGPHNTPTWRNRVVPKKEDSLAVGYQKDGTLVEPWAEKTWKNVIGEALFNIPLTIFCVGYNAGIVVALYYPIYWLLALYLGWSWLQMGGLAAAYAVIRIATLYLEEAPDKKLNVPPKSSSVETNHSKEGASESQPLLPTAAVQKRVAVIGGGPAGLVTAKELLAEGHDVQVFEQSNQIGGVWQQTSATEAQTKNPRGFVLSSTLTSSSALNTAFSDFPIQAEVPGFDPFFMKAGDYMDYLRRYAEYFDLVEHVQLNTSVQSVEKAPGDKWRVTTQKTTGNAAAVTHEFDSVAVCSGQTNVPRRIDIPGQEHFGGTILHTSQVPSDVDFETFFANLHDNKNSNNTDKPQQQQRVLVIGAGETASDLILDICRAEHVARCDVAVRNPVLVLHRNMIGAPPDYTEPRTMYQSPRWVRWGTYKILVLACLSFMGVFARKFRDQIIPVPSVTYLWRMLFTPKYLWETITFQRSACASLQTTKSDSLFFALRDHKDKCALKSGVHHIDPTTGSVVFDDETQQHYDVILLATGYKPFSYPFLPEPHRCNHLADRFLGVFDPELPNLGFIGFMRGNVGALILGFEMQARWFALLCSEKRRLPADMALQIAEAKRLNSSYNGTSGVWFYANYLARHYVGCEPNFVQWFVQHPASALKAYCGNFASYQFRMRGPHANVPAVLDGYALTDGVWYLPAAWHLNHLLWMLQGPLFSLYSQLPVIGILFKPMLSQWY